MAGPSFNPLTQLASMDSVLRRSCSSIFEAATREELHARLLAATEQLGFGVFCGLVVIDSPSGESQFICVDNSPAAAASLFEDPVQGKRDPVMQHCKVHSTPIAWDQATYVRAKVADKWEAQAPFGYRSGICAAMHLPKGRHFSLGMDSSSLTLPPGSANVSRLTSALLILTVYAQEAAMRLLAPPASKDEAFDVTPRELEVLRWTLEGKTAWEIGRILCIAENTVIRHAHSATHKLEGANKHHAAVKAWRAGLIG